MKSTFVLIAATLVATTAFAGDCSSTKMKQTDAKAAVSTKLAETPKRLQEAAKAEQQIPKQQIAQAASTASQSGR